MMIRWPARRATYLLGSDCQTISVLWTYGKVGTKKDNIFKKILYFKELLIIKKGLFRLTGALDRRGFRCRVLFIILNKYRKKH